MMYKRGMMIYISSFILSFMIQTIYAADFYLLDLYCANSDTPRYDMHGRKWSYDSDRITRLGKPLLGDTNDRINLVDETPFSTAMVSNSFVSLEFPISDPGRKYVRLYLYTTDYGKSLVFNLVDANFSVSANEKVLINFPQRRAHITDLEPTCLIYEFSVPVLSNSLSLMFFPDYEREASFAFINGIEIVSHPDIYTGNATLVTSGEQSLYDFVISEQASLANIVRLNVGGDTIQITDDSGQLFRTWHSDEKYLVGNTGVKVDAAEQNTVLTYPPPSFSEYVAPRLLYETARLLGSNIDKNMGFVLSWTIPVLSNRYYYLVRLHFCEVVGNILEENARVFRIYINHLLAESDVDLIAWTGKPGVPIYKDYVVFVDNPEKPEVRVDLTPDFSWQPTPTYNDTILSGIEVFQISDQNGDLDVYRDPFN